MNKGKEGVIKVENEEKETEQQVNEQVGEQEKNENNTNQEEKILRPTTPSEELLRNRENNNKHKELTAKVEHYNFNNGFKNTKQVNEYLVEVKEEVPLTTNQSSDEKIDIKPPKKKKTNTGLPILLIIILVGGIIYFYFFDNKELIIENDEQEEQIEEVPKDKQNKTMCRIASKMEAQKQNTIIEYIYYDKEEKLQSYEQRVTYEYLEEVPKSIVEECNLTNGKYEGYDGYSNVCVKNDELSYTFKTTVDLNKLEEKTLTFDNNTITITSSLDDDTSSFKKEYESANYECVTEEVVVVED